LDFRAAVRLPLLQAGALCPGQGKNPLLVSFDLKRLAAQDQWRIIAQSLDLRFMKMTADRMKSGRSLKELLTSFQKQGLLSPLIVDLQGGSTSMMS
jgi:signal recognition particle GTPase